MKRFVSVLVFAVSVFAAANAFAQCSGPNCQFSGGGYYDYAVPYGYYDPYGGYPPCLDGKCGARPSQVVVQQPAPVCTGPDCPLQRAVPQPVAPQPAPPQPAPAPAKPVPAPKAYSFVEVFDATEAAYADLDRRISAKLPYVACETDIRGRLKSANHRLETTPPLGIAVDGQSKRGFLSGDILSDSQLRLIAAAAVMKNHGQRDLAERFAAEACWVSKWRWLIDRADPQPRIETRKLWERIATIWSRNAEAVAATLLVKEEPFKQLTGYYSPEAARQIQSGSSWSDVFGIDQFYSESFVQARTRDWIFFKVIPSEFFKGEHDAPKDVTPHGVIQQEVRELVDRMSVFHN